MEAVLEVLETVSPHVASLDDLSGLSFELPSPPESGLKVLQDALSMGVSDSDRGVEADELKEESQDDESSSDPAPIPLSNHDSDAFAKAFVEAYKEEPEALKLLVRSIRSITARPRREHLLHGSLLAMAIGTLETAIAGVGTQHFVLHPGALSGSEKEFSLAELAEFEDLADARDLAISRRVADLMRGGFEAWDKWFDQLLGASFSEMAADHEVLHEAIQRRHLVAHNAGRVSRQYKAKVASCEESVGDDLPIDREYLETAIDAVTIFGARLILVAWSKWLPEDRNDAAEQANTLAFSYLQGDRYELARCIANTAKGFAEEDQTRLYLQVNEWLAEKHLKGLEEVRESIRSWDTTALSPEYTAAKAALLNDYDRLFEMLPHLIDQGVLTPRSLRKWPLFEGAREQDQWTSIEALLPEGNNGEENEATDPDAKDQKAMVEIDNGSTSPQTPNPS